MEKKVFVNVNSDSIQVYGFEKSKIVSFEEKGIRNPQPAIIAILIRECLDELLLSDKDVVIIPGPEYIICSEKITGHVKKTANQETVTDDCLIRVTKPDSLNESFIRRTRYISDGKSVKNFEALPLLQKYFANRKTVAYDNLFMNQICENLNKNEITVTGIVPMDFFLKKRTAKRLVNFRIGKNNSNISVSESGFITTTASFELGTDKIISDISNNFNVSVATAVKLLDKFGFVFLPTKYHNVVIDIPIYGSLMQSIPLTDLTFCIRESLKEIYSGIISILSAKVRDYYLDSEFCCDNFLKVNGADKLFELMLNSDIRFVENDSNSFQAFNSIYDSLAKADIKDMETIKENLVPQQVQEETEHVPFMERIGGILNSKIKSLLLEPEFQ
ncbi:MAG: hypothetical protein PHE56_02785 [Bacteroidales bacterium]|nr:hypothetical protein [Bacteroidales bacterium]